MLVDPDIRGDVAELVVILVAEATCGADRRVLRVSSMEEGRDEFLGIDLPQPLEISIGDDGGRIIPHHAVTMSRACPFREEATFPISIHQPFGHLRSLLRIDEVDEGHEGTEGIPIARVRVEIAWTYLPAVGAVVEYLALGTDLIETTREEQRAIETAVEGLHALLGVCDSDTTQLLLPYSPPLCSYLGIGAMIDFLKVGHRLLGADE